MIEGWSNLEAKDTSSPYAEICLEAVNDETVFQKFKQDPRYTAILEHVSIDHGKIYAQDILQYEIDEELINLFKENDSIGGSTIFNYGEPYGRISPSTLRYMQNALDISYFFGEGELNRIAEIGGGYGGLCKTISCLCDFEEYHIYDIEPASKLQKKYLSNFNITGKTIQHSVPEELKDIDLVVSNYAYSELNEELQTIYYDNVIANSNKVYMILNKGQVSREVFLKRAETDFDITIEKVLDFWPPNGYLYHTTMVKK
jgi:putative sugar O-methyltransferase